MNRIKGMHDINTMRTKAPKRSIIVYAEQQKLINQKEQIDKTWHLAEQALIARCEQLGVPYTYKSTKKKS